MQAFESVGELYDILGGFFEKVRHVQEAYLIHQVGGAIAFEFELPRGRLVWVPDPGDSVPFHVEEGADAQSLLTFRQNGDTAHRFWLGYLDLQQALARQQVRASGPLSRAMKLIPHLDSIYPVYHQHLHEIGREDLVWPRTGEPRP